MLERFKCKRPVYRTSQNGAEMDSVKSLFMAIWILFGNVSLSDHQLSSSDSQIMSQ